MSTFLIRSATSQPSSYTMSLAKVKPKYKVKNLHVHLNLRSLGVYLTSEDWEIRKKMDVLIKSAFHLGHAASDVLFK